MARKSRNRGGGQKIHGSQTSNSAYIGVPQKEDAKKVKSINSIQGIVPLDINLISKPTTPQGDGDSEVSRKSWEDRTEEEEKMNNNTGSTKINVWSNVVGKIPVEE